MSHTLKKNPTFTHRTEGETITGVANIDNLVSLEKLETMLAVMTDYTKVVVLPENQHHFGVLLDIARDELLDIKSRLIFQQKQTRNPLN